MEEIEPYEIGYEHSEQIQAEKSEFFTALRVFAEPSNWYLSEVMEFIFAALETNETIPKEKGNLKEIWHEIYHHPNWSPNYKMELFINACLNHWDPAQRIPLNWLTAGISTYYGYQDIHPSMQKNASIIIRTTDATRERLAIKEN